MAGILDMINKLKPGLLGNDPTMIGNGLDEATKQQLLNGGYGQPAPGTQAPQAPPAAPPPPQQPGGFYAGSGFYGPTSSQGGGLMKGIGSLSGGGGSGGVGGGRRVCRGSALHIAVRHGKRRGVRRCASTETAARREMRAGPPATARCASQRLRV
jgi:hypothetical protein